MTSEAIKPHPLDGCDPAECYQTMMGERTALITARREAEDNLIKTVIQLSAALLALLAGFISQAKMELSLPSVALFGVALMALAAAIICGLLEQRFSSEAYLAQQKMVEDYFQKKVAEFSEPATNRSVRKAQTAAFISFVVALLLLGAFAFVEARDNYVKAQESGTSSKGAAASATASTATTSVQGRQRRAIGGTVNAASPSKEVKRPTLPQ